MTRALHRRASRRLRLLSWGVAFVTAFVLAAAGTAAAYFTIKADPPPAGATATAALLAAPAAVAAHEVPHAAVTGVTVTWTSPSTQPPGAEYDVFEGSGANQTSVCSELLSPPCAVGQLAPATSYTFSVEAVLGANWHSPATSAGFTTLGVATTSLPAGTVGSSYSSALAPTGGVPGYTWSLTGSLPEGLTLRPTGTITGTPTSATTATGLVFTVTDSNGVTASSAPLSITIERIPSSLDVDAVPTHLVTGQPVVITAYVRHPKGTDPTGTVTFHLADHAGTPIDCLGGTRQPLILFDHAVCIPVSPLEAAGSPYTVAAQYSGDATFLPSTGMLTPPLPVKPDATTTSLRSSSGAGSAAAPGAAQKVTYTAIVAPKLPGSGTPGGSVTFTYSGKDGSSTTMCASVTLSGSVATCTDGPFTAAHGPYTVSAAYSPTSNYLASRASIPECMQKCAPATVPPNDSGLAITSPGTATFTANSPGSVTVTTTGSPTAQVSEQGALPAGVVFAAGSDGTATITGSPHLGTGGTYKVTLTASNGIAPNATQAFTLTVVTPLAGLTFVQAKGAKVTCTAATPARVSCAATTLVATGGFSAKVALVDASRKLVSNTSGTPLLLHASYPTALSSPLDPPGAGGTTGGGSGGGSDPSASAATGTTPTHGEAVPSSPGAAPGALSTPASTEPTSTGTTSDGTGPSGASASGTHVATTTTVIGEGKSSSKTAFSVTGTGPSHRTLVVTLTVGTKTYSITVTTDPVRTTAIERPRRGHRTGHRRHHVKRHRLDPAAR